MQRSDHVGQFQVAGWGPLPNCIPPIGIIDYGTHNTHTPATPCTPAQTADVPTTEPSTPDQPDLTEYRPSTQPGELCAQLLGGMGASLRHNTGWKPPKVGVLYTMDTTSESPFGSRPRFNQVLGSGPPVPKQVLNWPKTGQGTLEPEPATAQNCPLPHGVS